MPTPPPSPARPGQTHFEDPADGPCFNDERNITVDGTWGAYCAPQCTGILKQKCPSDLPLGTTAEAECLIKDEDEGISYCALVCDNTTTCPKKATCKSLGAQSPSICTYDDAGPPAPPSPAPTPPPPTPKPTPPTPAPPTPPPTPPTPVPPSHYHNPADGCLSDETVEKLGVGSICSAECIKKGLKRTCPTDVPAGVTAEPSCDLTEGKIFHKKHFCGLSCLKDAECGSVMKCQVDTFGSDDDQVPEQTFGYCYYPDKNSTQPAMYRVKH